MRRSFWCVLVRLPPNDSESADTVPLTTAMWQHDLTFVPFSGDDGNGDVAVVALQFEMRNVAVRGGARVWLYGGERPFSWYTANVVLDNVRVQQSPSRLLLSRVSQINATRVACESGARLLIRAGDRTKSWQFHDVFLHGSNSTLSLSDAGWETGVSGLQVLDGARFASSSRWIDFVDARFDSGILRLEQSASFRNLDVRNSEWLILQQYSDRPLLFDNATVSVNADKPFKIYEREVVLRTFVNISCDGIEMFPLEPTIANGTEVHVHKCETGTCRQKFSVPAAPFQCHSCLTRPPGWPRNESWCGCEFGRYTTPKFYKIKCLRCPSGEYFDPTRVGIQFRGEGCVKCPDPSMPQTDEEGTGCRSPVCPIATKWAQSRLQCISCGRTQFFDNETEECQECPDGRVSDENLRCADCIAGDQFRDFFLTSDRNASDAFACRNCTAVAAAFAHRGECSISHATPLILGIVLALAVASALGTFALVRRRRRRRNAPRNYTTLQEERE